MTFQAKSNLAMMAILTLVYGGYFVIVMSWAVDGSVADISWQPLMLLTAVPVTVLAIIAHSVIALIAPSEAGTSDERDRQIDLRGEWLGGIVLAVGVFCGLVLTMFEVDPFWIAQTLLGGLVVSEIAKYARTLMLYARGH